MNRVSRDPRGETGRGLSLVGWLVRPGRWSLMDGLLLAGIVLVAVSLLATHVNDLLGDACVLGWGLACAMALVVALFRRWTGVGEAEAGLKNPEKRVSRCVDHALFWLALAATFLAFSWLFLTQLYVNEDPNPEAMDCPMAVHFMEQARQSGRSLAEILDQDPMLRHWREQDPQYTRGLGERFKLLWVAQAHSALNLAYVPFVKASGITRQTIVLYSTCYATLAWIATGWLAWRIGGRWCALLALNWMTGSLGWLIHVRVGYQQVTPSVLLMAVLGLALFEYAATRRRAWLAVAGVSLALMYLVGWIVVVFGVLFAVAGVLLLGRRGGQAMVTDVAILGCCAVMVALLLPLAYGATYGISGWEVHRAIAEMMFGRFQQGEPGLLQLSLGGKSLYAFRCLFIDSQTLDGHVDKYLEGSPAIPWVFSAFLVLGLLYAIKERDVGDRVTLLWMLAVLGVLGTAFIFGHRYAMMALPAMGIVAARGAVRLGGDLWNWKGRALAIEYGGALAAALAITVWSTHQEFYVSYLRQKPANFELDRLRGHYAFVQWLRTHGDPEDTLVVLGDPIMFSATQFVFNTFDRPWPWLYWSNLLKSGMDADAIARWEREQLGRYSRIIYAFSPTLLGNPRQDGFMNDWRPFLQIHPGARPTWAWSYANRPPAILAFEVRGAVNPSTGETRQNRKGSAPVSRIRSE